MIRASSPGKNAIVAFFPLAQLAAKLLAAPEIATCVAILRSHPAINAAQGILPRAARGGEKCGLDHAQSFAFQALGDITQGFCRHMVVVRPRMSAGLGFEIVVVRDANGG